MHFIAIKKDALKEHLVIKGRNRFVGKETSVLTVENKRKGSTLCRDDNYRPFILKQELPLGEFYDVKITGAYEYDVVGKVVNE